MSKAADPVAEWVSDLEAAGWKRHASMSTIWVAPWGGWYRGPFRAWQIMKEMEKDSNG